MNMNIQEKFVITVNRELGSGGRTVGRKLAERLEVKYYDKALIQGLTKEFGLTVEEIGRETYIKKYVEMNPELRSSLPNVSRYDTRNYDLVINMDGLTEDDAVEVIMSYIDRTSKR